MQDGYDSMFNDTSVDIARKNTGNKPGYDLAPISITKLAQKAKGSLGNGIGDSDSVAHLINQSQIMPPRYRRTPGMPAPKVELPFLTTGSFVGTRDYPGGTRFDEGAYDGSFVGGRDSEIMSSSGSITQETLCAAARVGARVPARAVRLAQGEYNDANIARRANQQYPMPGAAYGAQAFRAGPRHPGGMVNAPFERQASEKLARLRAGGRAQPMRGACRAQGACDGAVVYNEGAGTGQFVGQPAVNWGRFQGYAAVPQGASINDMDGVLGVGVGALARRRML